MKKSTIQALVSYIDGVAIDNLSEIRGELVAELHKYEVKVNAKREIYDAAHDSVMKAISMKPLTVQEILAQANLPEGFTRAKLQYALREMWKDEIVTRMVGRVHTYGIE